MDTGRPWLRHYGAVPSSLDYPKSTLAGALAQVASERPESAALAFFGWECTYRELMQAIERCAAALAGLGLRRGDRILVSMPTTPQAVIAFYAANRLGAASAMIHPLSTPAEIAMYVAASRARIVLTLDAFYANVAGTPGIETIVLARIPDYLSLVERIGFWATKGRHIKPVPANVARVSMWRDLMARPAPPAPPSDAGPDDLAAILFSGGTTSLPKAISLSNRNFIAEGKQAATWVGLSRGSSLLAIMPLFHGFGLGVCVNAVLMGGGTSILVPTFTAESVAKLVRAKRPNFLVGVPTLFDALTRDERFARSDLSCLKAAFSGADTLPRPVKERFEALVAARGGKVRLLEGYGLTEAVSGIMAMPLDEYREGSIGVPLPDILAAICEPGSTRHLPPGTEGEICISGDPVMMGYIDDAAASAEALRRHDDGRTWLHTGDLGRMDEDGFFYFTGRLKRMIKSSGFNVYPAQVESVLYRHAAVKDACVVGVPDSHQVERVKAFVVPKPGVRADAALGEALIAHCRGELIKWSCPREVEFREALPTTRLGKIDYRALMEAERARR
jgi:long-chain acyl-CoA synthetase